MAKHTRVSYECAVRELVQSPVRARGWCPKRDIGACVHGREQQIESQRPEDKLLASLKDSTSLHQGNTGEITSNGEGGPLRNV